MWMCDIINIMYWHWSCQHRHPTLSKILEGRLGWRKKWEHSCPSHKLMKPNLPRVTTCPSSSNRRWMILFSSTMSIRHTSAGPVKTWSSSSTNGWSRNSLPLQARRNNQWASNSDSILRNPKLVIMWMIVGGAVETLNPQLLGWSDLSCLYEPRIYDL